MSTIMMTDPEGLVSAHESPLFHRWRRALPAQCRTKVPEALLALYYATAADGQPLEAEAIALACACDEATAEAWGRLMSAWLLDPRLYTPVFDAEDQCAAERVRRMHYTDEVQRTRTRLAELDQEIAARKHLAMLGADHAAAEAEAIQALDAERVGELRHQGDLPDVGSLVEQSEVAARQQLTDAQAALEAAWSVHVQQVERAWTTWADEALQPALAVLSEARQVLDVLCRMRELDKETAGSERLRVQMLGAVRSHR